MPQGAEPGFLSYNVFWMAYTLDTGFGHFLFGSDSSIIAFVFNLACGNFCFYYGVTRSICAVNRCQGSLIIRITCIRSTQCIKLLCHEPSSALWGAIPNAAILDLDQCAGIPDLILLVDTTSIHRLSEKLCNVQRTKRELKNKQVRIHSGTHLRLTLWRMALTSERCSNSSDTHHLRRQRSIRTC